MARHNPSVWEGNVASFLLTLPQWGLCDLIAVPPTPFSFDSNAAAEEVQLAMKQEPRSALCPRHQQWLTMSNSPKVSAWNLFIPSKFLMFTL